MNSLNQFIALFFIITVASIYIVNGNERIKREYASFHPLSDLTSTLDEEDLEEGLRSLSSSELRMLSEFVDKEDKNTDGNGFQDSWNGKKKRTMDDLYDEIAHENAEVDFRQQYHGNPSKILTNDGRCHCMERMEQARKDEAIRSKRHNCCKEKVQKKRSVNDEYVKDLEQSFPREQLTSLKDNHNNVQKTEHVRIKRL